MRRDLLRKACDRRAVFAVLAATTVIMFVSHLGAYDLWWHLKAGGDILRTGVVPRADPFSFTAAGAPWTYHSWLSGVLLHAVHAVSGVPGLILLRAALVASSLLLSWVAARRRGVGAGLAAVLVLASCYQLRPRALTRPYLFSFVLFVLFYMVVQRTFRQTARAPDGPASSGGAWRFLWGDEGRLLLLPAMTLAWANLHGGFLVGLLLIGAFGAGEMIELAVRRRGRALLRTLLTEDAGARFRALLSAGLLCLLASLVTPYGPGTLLYPLRLLTQVKLTAQVQEWRPMPLSGDFALCWALMALSVPALARSARALTRGGQWKGRVGQFCADAFLLAGFGLLAVRSVRHLTWFVLLAPPVLGYHLTAARSAILPRGTADRVDERREIVYTCAAYALALVLILGQLFGAAVFGFGVRQDRLPVRACDYLQDRRDLQGRFYNAYEWGGYLIWRFGPERKVFIDGRCLVYGDRVMGEALTVAHGRPGWERILRDVRQIGDLFGIGRDEIGTLQRDIGDHPRYDKISDRMGEEKSIGLCAFGYDTAEFSLVTQILVPSDQVIQLKEHLFLQEILRDNAVYLEIGSLCRLIKGKSLARDQNEYRLFGGFLVS